MTPLSPEKMCPRGEAPRRGRGTATSIQRVQRGQIPISSGCGGKSFGIRRNIGGKSRTSMRIREILWETPALRPWGKGLAQVPDQYPRGNIHTPQISPPRRGRRSRALAGYGVQPGRGPRRFGVVVRRRQERPVFVDPGSIPLCHPDCGQPHKYPFGLTGSLRLTWSGELTRKVGASYAQAVWNVNPSSALFDCSKVFGRRCQGR